MPFSTKHIYVTFTILQKTQTSNNPNPLTSSQLIFTFTPKKLLTRAFLAYLNFPAHASNPERRTLLHRFPSQPVQLILFHERQQKHPRVCENCLPVNYCVLDSNLLSQYHSALSTSPLSSKGIDPVTRETRGKRSYSFPVCVCACTSVCPFSLRLLLLLQAAATATTVTTTTRYRPRKRRVKKSVNFIDQRFREF